MPLVYESSGEVFGSKDFIHQRRCLDTFVIIICIEGSLHIIQDSYHHSLRAGDYLVLFAGHVHWGFKSSDAPVTYYWCHFSVEGGNYRVAAGDELMNFVELYGGGGGGGIIKYVNGAAFRTAPGVFLF
jgi:hypothetical protein